MTEQTEGAEVALADQLDRWERGHDGANETDHWADRLARALLASDWLAAREAAAEVRGAQAALLKAADEGPLHFAATHTGRDARGWNVVEADWLRARAADAADGGGGARTGPGEPPDDGLAYGSRTGR